MDHSDRCTHQIRAVDIKAATSHLYFRQWHATANKHSHAHCALTRRELCMVQANHEPGEPLARSANRYKLSDSCVVPRTCPCVAPTLGLVGLRDRGHRVET